MLDEWDVRREAYALWTICLTSPRLTPRATEARRTAVSWI